MIAPDDEFCCATDCAYRPVYAFRGNRAEFCWNHRLPGMVDILRDGYHSDDDASPPKRLKAGRLCNFGDCRLLACFGRNDVPEFCQAHAPPGYIALLRPNMRNRVEVARDSETEDDTAMVEDFETEDESPDVAPDQQVFGDDCGIAPQRACIVRAKARCAVTGCERMPLFGDFGKIPTHCEEHARDKPTFTKVVATCEHPDCNTPRPHFGLPGEIPTYCKYHTLAGMVNLFTYKGCIVAGCGKRAVQISDMLSKYCSVHFRGISGGHKPCEFGGCSGSALFSVGVTPPKFCLEHARTMKNRSPAHRRSGFCRERGCRKRASFALVGEQPQYCRTHAARDMVNVIRNHCIFAGCKHQSKFGKPGERPKNCAHHAPPDTVDRIGVRCSIGGCAAEAIFGALTKRPEFCRRHAPPGMVNQRNIGRCDVMGCSKLARFGVVGGTASKCSEHATADLTRLVVCSRKRKHDE